ncbi:hypothetical protein JCM5353_005447 [Sporobolomyces roseus]
MATVEASKEGQKQEQQCLVILAGVVGSGKSSLSSAWSKALPNWVRVNQDDLGDRRTCEQVLKSHLSQGRSVVLDRQNFDRGQRRTWLEIGNDFRNLKVCGMVMGTRIEDCRSRLMIRQNHPTIDNPRLALDLLDKFTGLWEEPQLDEGFDQLITLPSLPPAPAIDAALISTLLALLYASPLNPLAYQQRQRKPPPPRSQYGVGTSAAGTYRRPDGFVDDGSWRPPQSRAPPPGQVSNGQQGGNRPTQSQPGAGAWGAAPPPVGYQPPQVSRWAQGPPHHWGSGNRLGENPQNANQQ